MSVCWTVLCVLDYVCGSDCSVCMCVGWTVVCVLDYSVCLSVCWTIVCVCVCVGLYCLGVLVLKV